MDEQSVQLHIQGNRPTAGGSFPAGGLIDMLARSCSGLIALIDADGTLVYASPAHRSALGHDPDSLVGHTVAQLLHQEDLPLMERVWAEALGTGEARAVCRVLHADGAWHRVACDLSVVEHGGERITLAVGHDLTLQEERETALLQSQRAMLLGMVAGGYVHDINNLLTVIEGGALFATEDLPVEHEAHEHLAAVRQAAIVAAGMSRRLLAFVRRQSLVVNGLDLRDFCREALPLFGRLLGSRIMLQADIPQALWLVRADRLQVEQLLMNLLVNARDAMPEGGSVQVRAYNTFAGEAEGVAPGQYVCLEVVDAGGGIDPAIRHRLFEPFFSGKTGGKGVGLGLATCSHIVSELRGAITVESTLGAGATFRVYLPRLIPG